MSYVPSWLPCPFPERVRLTGQTIVDASARPGPATLVFDDRIRNIVTEGQRDKVADTRSLAGFIVPGLIDSHTHPLEAGLQMLFTNLSGASSVTEVQERLRAHRQDALEHGGLYKDG